MFWGVLTMVGMLFASSCSQNELLDNSVDSENYVSATFILNSPEEAITSRADIGDGTMVNKVVCATFDQYGTELKNLRQYREITKKKAQYSIRLVKGQNYRVAFFAYYAEEGYPTDGVIEYLLNLANYTFEDFRRNNKTAHWSEFKLEMNKMSNSGGLFDLVKLNDVCKNKIASYTAEQVYELAIKWAEEYDKELYALLTRDKDFSVAMFNFDRNPEKPRKDIGKFNEVRNSFSYMFDELFDGQYEEIPNVDKAKQKEIIEIYKEIYDETADKDTWFATLKEVATKVGFAAEVKEYKQNPEAFGGHVGDVSTVVRVAVTGRTRTPDLWGILKTLGKNKSIERMEKYIKELN